MSLALLVTVAVLIATAYYFIFVSGKSSSDNVKDDNTNNSRAVQGTTETKKEEKPAVKKLSKAEQKQKQRQEAKLLKINKAKPPSHPRFLKRFGGHTSEALSMSISPNGEWMATTGDEGALRVSRIIDDDHDASSTPSFRVQPDKRDRIVRTSWCPDSRTIACAFQQCADVTFYRMRKKPNPSEKDKFPYELVELVKRRFHTESKFDDANQDEDDQIVDCVVDPTDSSFPMVLIKKGMHKGRTAVAWDGKSGGGKAASPLGSAVTGPGLLRVSPDGIFLSGSGVGASKELKIYEIVRKKVKGEVHPIFSKLSNKSVMTIVAKNYITDAAFFCLRQEGFLDPRAVVCCQDGTVEVWNVDVQFRNGEDPKKLCSTSMDEKGTKPTGIAVGRNGDKVLFVLATPSGALHFFTYSEKSSSKAVISKDFSIEDTHHARGVGDMQFSPIEDKEVLYTRGHASANLFAWNVKKECF